MSRSQGLLGPQTSSKTRFEMEAMKKELDRVKASARASRSREISRMVRAAQDLDLAFLFDATSSMGRYMEVVKDKILKIVHEAKGGNDTAEDVFSGLEALSKLDWTAHNRVVYHIVDAPCHGTQFHDSKIGTQSARKKVAFMVVSTLRVQPDSYYNMEKVLTGLWTKFNSNAGPSLTGLMNAPERWLW
ncbi:hypothetical protein L7F22_054437 [Adiantum nelumboides]|nr:hypothetical protein [Adiantum nelumboides]